MTRWNIVGIQGSLLTHIINPIYFHTVPIYYAFFTTKILKNLKSLFLKGGDRKSFSTEQLTEIIDRKSGEYSGNNLLLNFHDYIFY